MTQLQMLCSCWLDQHFVKITSLLGKRGRLNDPVLKTVYLEETNQMKHQRLEIESLKWGCWKCLLRVPYFYQTLSLYWKYNFGLLKLLYFFKILQQYSSRGIKTYDCICLVSIWWCQYWTTNNRLMVGAKTKKPN